MAWNLSSIPAWERNGVMNKIIKCVVECVIKREVERVVIRLKAICEAKAGPETNGKMMRPRI